MKRFKRAGLIACFALVVSAVFGAASASAIDLKYIEQEARHYYYASSYPATITNVTPAKMTFDFPAPDDKITCTVGVKKTLPWALPEKHQEWIDFNATLTGCKATSAALKTEAYMEGCDLEQADYAGISLDPPGPHPVRFCVTLEVFMNGNSLCTVSIGQQEYPYMWGVPTTMSNQTYFETIKGVRMVINHSKLTYTQEGPSCPSPGTHSDGVWQSTIDMRAE